MTQVAPAFHEFGGYLKYGEHGLAPYWFLSALFESTREDEDPSIEVRIDDESWTVRLQQRSSGFAPPPEGPDTDRLDEYDVVARGDDERKVTYQVSPRCPNMRHYETGDPIAQPFDHLDPEEGIVAHVQGSNLTPAEYRRLLPLFVRALGQHLGHPAPDQFFQQPILDGGPAASNVYACERYVRVERSLNENIVCTGGIMDKLSMHLSDQRGTEGSYKWDNDDVVGHHHRLKMSSTDASELVSEHRLGKQIKHYLLEHPESVDESNPTWHPKIGVLFRKTWNDRESVPWKEIDSVIEELDETLLGILEWADIPLDLGGATYVPDDHFDAEARREDLQIHPDPTPKLEWNAVLNSALRVTVRCYRSWDH